MNYLKSINAQYIDDLLRQYRSDPSSIDESWRYFFDGLEFGELGDQEPHGKANGKIPEASAADLLTQFRLFLLTQAYREHGHKVAKIDPLGALVPRGAPIAPVEFGLNPTDPVVHAAVSRLQQIYCGPIGVETAHISERKIREWVHTQMESAEFNRPLDTETRQFILKRLTEASVFENFIHTRYVAQKRFSLEGGECLIPALDRILETGSASGATHFVLGMAHRGRLNVLHNVYHKKAEQIFSEFEDNYEADPLDLLTGDVKYHKGYSKNLEIRNKKSVHLTLAFNPSHLEFVNPVVEGAARAKQQLLKDAERSRVIPILVHGDAALSGQGVCFETLNFSQVPAYTTGGSIHIVVNNQVGFTTDPADGRSGPYASDLGRALDIPIFHVNGDDPEAVWRAMGLAVLFRQSFKRDVFIDLVCFRRYGHNEGDEPAFTQPLLYQAIKTHPPVYELYSKSTQLPAVSFVESTTATLTDAQNRVRAEKIKPVIAAYEAEWAKFRPAQDKDIWAEVETKVSSKILVQLAQKLNRMPQGFELHSKLGRFFEARLKAVEEGKGIDWGGGEALAYASLLVEGRNIRITGQDCERGTFTHRHAVVHDVKTGAIHTPHRTLTDDQGDFYIKNSTLSETAVMGFEYGYSLSDPDSLVIWEAQFGDFANGAQVIIDQFLAAGEAKWQRANGLVLLLPHGYEGQGPEHSSARLERFLGLCSKNNMFVCNFTTPSQLFHALRRHIKRPFRKPMVILSPKSLLRHPEAVSDLREFSEGSFQEVLDDPLISSASRQKTRSILLCSGKIYYDLLAERTARASEHIAIIRVEQLHPFPADTMAKILASYSPSASITWVQEEPRNMGAWPFVFSLWMGGSDSDKFSQRVGSRPIAFIGRSSAASPAVGSLKLHTAQQKEILNKALS